MMKSTQACFTYQVIVKKNDSPKESKSDLHAPYNLAESASTSITSDSIKTLIKWLLIFFTMTINYGNNEIQLGKGIFWSLNIIKCLRTHANCKNYLL